MLVEVGCHPPYHRFATRTSAFTVDVETFIGWIRKVTFAGVPGPGFALADGMVVAGAALLEQTCEQR